MTMIYTARSMHTISEFCINDKINVLKFEMKIRTFITIAKLKKYTKAGNQIESYGRSFRGIKLWANCVTNHYILRFNEFC